MMQMLEEVAQEAQVALAITCPECKRQAAAAAVNVCDACERYYCGGPVCYRVRRVTTAHSGRYDICSRCYGASEPLC